MLERTLRLLATCACGFLLVSLGLFAVDQSGTASQQAQTEVNHAGAQALGPPVSVGAHHSAVRVAIDDTADALSSPFAILAPGSADAWGYRMFTTMLGLLVYGFGLGAIARYVALARLRPPHEPQSWSSF